MHLSRLAYFLEKLEAVLVADSIKGKVVNHGRTNFIGRT